MVHLFQNPNIKALFLSAKYNDALGVAQKYVILRIVGLKTKNKRMTYDTWHVTFDT